MTISITSALDNDQVSLQLLKVLAENSFDSILITDTTKAGRVIYANKAFKKLAGYGQDEIVGKTPRELQGVGTSKEVIAELRAALSTGRKFEGRAINYKKDGTPFIMHWRVLPVKLGGDIKAWIAIQRESSGS
jgi:PAS domain S-box-containing protein